LVLLAAVLSACADDLPDGEMVFRSRVADGNTFTCATCHAVTETDADGLRRPGHPIGDAAARPTYKNGKYSSMLDAVNTCLDEWMGAETWSADDSRWVALRGWLEGLAPRTSAPALEFAIVKAPSAVSGGDPVAGHALFDRSCAVCHGLGGAGTERGPSITGRGYETDFVAERIRTSGAPDSRAYAGLTGGRMPFWAADRLTDAEVLDLAEYVHTSALPTDGGPGPGSGGGLGGDRRECASTHAKVGQTAELATHAHGVRGTVRIVDDCTFVIEHFYYDGGVIDVRVYGGIGGDYDHGFVTSPNILGTPYMDGMLEVQLPVGKTFDDLDGISVWCVAAELSLGDGLFAP
jgi:mono/diheme cytochrome c family protein